MTIQYRYVVFLMKGDGMLVQSARYETLGEAQDWLIYCQKKNPSSVYFLIEAMVYA